MLKWGKWLVLLLSVVAITMLASNSYAQQSRGNASFIGSESFAQFSPVPKKAKRAAIAKCQHLSDCRYCCRFPASGNTSCVFDLQLCGQ
jgi:hypothetical protein